MDKNHCPHIHTREVGYHRTFVYGGEIIQEDKEQIICADCGEVLQNVEESESIPF